MKRLVVAIAGTLFAVACSNGYSPSSSMPISPSASTNAPSAVGSSPDQASAPTHGPNRIGFGFNAIVRGFLTGKVFVTGGGSFDLGTHVAVGNGGFRCIDPVLQGPLSVSINPNDPGACQAGEGVRWDTASLVDSTTFKCTGAGAEPLKPAVTGDHLVVLQSDFYRAGDGNDESFHAKIIVSDRDIASDFPGVNVWVEKVGCGVAQSVNFSK
jgi:hypothetical protein